MPIKRILLIILGSLVLAVSLFFATSLIDRHGPAVRGWQYSGEAPYRHANGVPFIFLERSLPDGVWQPTTQPPGYDPDSGHELSLLYLVTDMVFWICFAGLIVVLYVTLKPPGDNKSSQE